MYRDSRFRCSGFEWMYRDSRSRTMGFKWLCKAISLDGNGTKIFQESLAKVCTLNQDQHPYMGVSKNRGSKNAAQKS